MTITLTREEAQQVLDALELVTDLTNHDDELYKAIETLRARLSAPEPEPVAYLCENAVGHKYFRWKKPQSIFKPIALYTAPPQRGWQGLTDEEIKDILDCGRPNLVNIKKTEQKLKEKNT